MSSIEDWAQELEEIPVNPTCSLDDPECEACGS
jgi:hypothetical protein